MRVEYSEFWEQTGALTYQYHLLYSGGVCSNSIGNVKSTRSKSSKSSCVFGNVTVIRQSSSFGSSTCIDSCSSGGSINNSHDLLCLY